MNNQNHPTENSFDAKFAILALFVGGIIMGFSPVFVRMAEVDAHASAFWRILFALPFLYAWYRYEKHATTRHAFPQFPLRKEVSIEPLSGDSPEVDD